MENSSILKIAIYFFLLISYSCHHAIECEIAYKQQLYKVYNALKNKNNLLFESVEIYSDTLSEIIQAIDETQKVLLDQINDNPKKAFDRDLTDRYIVAHSNYGIKVESLVMQSYINCNSNCKRYLDYSVSTRGWLDERLNSETWLDEELSRRSGWLIGQLIHEYPINAILYLETLKSNLFLWHKCRELKKE